MAENKKSFLLYCDLIHTVSKLPNDKAGELLKHILAYVNDENPVTDDLIVSIAFEPIKQSLKRDLEKYEKIRERNSSNGKLGGRPKKPKKPSGLIGNPEEPKKADSDSDSDSVKDNDISIYKEKDFLQRWKDARMHYDKQPTNITKLESHEKANFNIILQNYKKEDIDMAISGLFFQNTYPKTRLRPTHFLELSNFETYLTCWNTKEKLFKKPKLKRNDGI